MDTTDDDYALALQLSIQESDITSLPQRPNSAKKKFSYDSSLVDPCWEVIDPTPDIYVLFVNFDKQFFWNKLSSVEINWSKRMTLCAGLCRYEPKAGLCSIRLSLPLLKLRPRKDLVETLLHEMIHAYLFVTHNNRDRDDHGPTFQEHMFRINKEGGTNITIYHSFHDEVNVYKTHWWKCDGPCQRQPPFFGMVKRAVNRAPNHNDNWWAQHEAKCGGQFIKIREPENVSKKIAKPVKSAPGKDISQYFNKVNHPVSSPAKKPHAAPTEHNGNTSINGTSSGPLSNRSKIGTLFSNVTSSGNTLNTISSGSKNTGNVKSPDPGRIHGFDNIKNKFGGTIKSKGGTLVIMKTTDNFSNNSNPISKTTVDPNNNPLRINTFMPFSGTGHTLGGTSSVRNESRLLTINRSQPRSNGCAISNTVRINNPVSNQTAMESPSMTSNDNCMPSSEKPIDLDSDDETEDVVSCPVCGCSINRLSMLYHLDNCSGLADIFNNSGTLEDEDDDDNEDTGDITITNPNTNVDRSTIDDDIEMIFNDCETDMVPSNNLNTNASVTNNDDDIEIIFDEREQATPNGCNLGNNVAGSTDVRTILNENESEIIPVNVTEDSFVCCPCCEIRVKNSEINSHLDKCLNMQLVLN